MNIVVLIERAQDRPVEDAALTGDMQD